MKKQYLCEVLFKRNQLSDTWVNVAPLVNAHRYPTNIQEARSIISYVKTINKEEIVATRIRVRSVTPWKEVE